MRDYALSFAVVALILIGYTFAVLSSKHHTNHDAHQRASNELRAAASVPGALPDSKDLNPAHPTSEAANSAAP